MNEEQHTGGLIIAEGAMLEVWTDRSLRGAFWHLQGITPRKTKDDTANWVTVRRVPE